MVDGVLEDIRIGMEVSFKGLNYDPDVKLASLIVITIK